MNNRELKTIIKLFEDSSLAKMKLQKDDMTIELEKRNEDEIMEPKVRPHVEYKEVKQEPTNEVKSSFHAVNAPLVGTYYEAPSPDQGPFVTVGDKVNKGDTLFIIEAMKVMNEITAPKDGIIKAIHSKNGEMVMYDQTVMEIG